MDITSYCLFGGYYVILFNTVSLVDFIFCCFFVGYHLTRGGLQVSFSWSGTDVFRGWRTRWENFISSFHKWTKNKAEVSESHFFNLETRMRIYRFNLAHRDETENLRHLISGFETRLRKTSFNLRHRDEIEIYYIHSQAFSVFETRTRFLKVAVFPWIQAWTASYFACNLWEANYKKCTALHFALCSPILKWPSHFLLAHVVIFSTVAINITK